MTIVAEIGQFLDWQSQSLKNDLYYLITVEGKKNKNKKKITQFLDWNQSVESVLSSTSACEGGGLVVLIPTLRHHFSHYTEERERIGEYLRQHDEGNREFLVREEKV